MEAFCTSNRANCSLWGFQGHLAQDKTPERGGHVQGRLHEGWKAQFYSRAQRDGPGTRHRLGACLPHSVPPTADLPTLADSGARGLGGLSWSEVRGPKAALSWVGGKPVCPGCQLASCCARGVQTYVRETPVIFL